MRPTRGNAILIAAAVGILFLAGLIAHGALGAVLVLVVAAVLAAISRQAWPVLDTNGRVLRVLIVAAVVAVAVAKLVA